MIEFIDFIADHLIEFKYDGLETDIPAYIPEEYNTNFVHSKQVKTIIADDKVIGFVGLMQINKDTFQLWGFLNKAIRDCKLSLYKTLKRELRTLNYPRLQVLVGSHLEPAQRLIEHLGFVQEGLLRKFTDNKDYYIYSIIGGA